jgi:hypothetical protein
MFKAYALALVIVLAPWFAVYPYVDKSWDGIVIEKKQIAYGGCWVLIDGWYQYIC